MPAEKMTVAFSVACGAAAASIAVCLMLATRETGEGSTNGTELVCDPLLQPFGVVAWVISFAFSALWLLTHCKIPCLLPVPVRAILCRAILPC